MMRAIWSGTKAWNPAALIRAATTMLRSFFPMHLAQRRASNIDKRGYPVLSFVRSAGVGAVSAKQLGGATRQAAD
jgi:hypothetical protein